MAHTKVVAGFMFVSCLIASLPGCEKSDGKNTETNVSKSSESSSRIHFEKRKNDSPLDESEVLFADGVELAELPAYNWKITRLTATEAEFEGMCPGEMCRDDEYNENTDYSDCPVTARLIRSGRFDSPISGQYDVYYLYYDLRMMTANLNIRGEHRALFVKDGKVVEREYCSDPVIAVDGEFYEKDSNGDFKPRWPLWFEAECREYHAQTLVTENYRVKIIDARPEGFVTWDNVIYYGTSIKTGREIILRGSTLHMIGSDGCPAGFLGYRFRNHDVCYTVLTDGQLLVTNDEGETLVDEKGEWED